MAFTTVGLSPRAAGQVGRARLAGRVDQVGDELDIVLGHFDLMRLPHPLEIGRLPIRIRHSLHPPVDNRSPLIQPTASCHDVDARALAPASSIVDRGPKL